MATPNHAHLPENSFQHGIEQFNRGEYYACHDTLEALWMEAPASEKPFYQGILQIAVALYHLGNHNWQGAATLLGEGIRRLEPYEPDHCGVDVTGLIDCADTWLTALQTLGPDRVAVLAEAAAAHPQAAADAAATTATANDPESSRDAIAGLDFPLPTLLIRLKDAFAT